MAKFNPAYIAKKLERSRDSISDYLSGKREPPKTVAMAWAVALELDPMALWDEHEASDPKPAA